MTLGQVIAEAWLKLWETAISYIPLPRGLADFTAALLISAVLILIYRYNKRLCYAVLTTLAGTVLLSAIIYHTSPV